jgi:hypothetical protein
MKSKLVSVDWLKKRKIVLNLIAFIVLANSFFSCSHEEKKQNSVAEPSISVADTSEKIISNESFDSLLDKGKIAERKNAEAVLNDSGWVSTGYSVNVFPRDKKKVFSIFLTNGQSFITINYSGELQIGKAKVGDNMQAGLNLGRYKVYSAQSGTVTFSQFDTTAKKLSGSFSFDFVSISDKKVHSKIRNGKFSDLTWNNSL